MFLGHRLSILECDTYISSNENIHYADIQVCRYDDMRVWLGLEDLLLGAELPEPGAVCPDAPHLEGRGDVLENTANTLLLT